MNAFALVRGLLKIQRLMLRLSECKGKTCFDFAEQEQLHCKAITRTNRVKRSYLMDNEHLRDEVQRKDLKNLEVPITEKGRIFAPL